MRVEAKTSTLDMIVGPTVLSALISAVLTFAAGVLIWGEAEVKNHLEIAWAFAAFFPIFLFLFVRFNLRNGTWLIENGTLYRGSKPLFQLGEVESVRLGLPDNWITSVANLSSNSPVRVKGAGGVQFAAWRQKQIVVLRLNRNRWMMWSGTQYSNFEAFRDALLSVAPEDPSEDIPGSILPQLKLYNVNKVLYGR